MTERNPGTVTGVHFPLAEFERQVAADPEITSVVYAGSLGSGTGDAYSDLDIEVWVTPVRMAQPDAELGRIMTLLGDVQFMYGRGPRFATGFVGDSWQRVDIGIHEEGSLVPEDLTHGTVVKGELPKQEARMGRDPAPAPSLFEARLGIEEAVDSQIYLALHNGRGHSWSAAGEIVYRAGMLFTLWASLRGKTTHGFRSAEDLLGPAELALLNPTWPKVCDKREVRRAARALWTWTEWTWARAEEELGTPLGIDLDRAGLLAAVDGIYRFQG